MHMRRKFEPFTNFNWWFNCTHRKNSHMEPQYTEWCQTDGDMGLFPKELIKYLKDTQKFKKTESLITKILNKLLMSQLKAWKGYNKMIQEDWMKRIQQAKEKETKQRHNTNKQKEKAKTNDQRHNKRKLRQTVIEEFFICHPP